MGKNRDHFVLKFFGNVSISILEETMEGKAMKSFKLFSVENYSGVTKFDTYEEALAFARVEANRLGKCVTLTECKPSIGDTYTKWIWPN